MPKRFDLHIHSIYSDGSLSPGQIFSEARRQGVKAISITDHASIQAYMRFGQAFPGIYASARAHGIELIPGIEMPASFEGREIDLLGYYFNPQHPAIREIIEKQHRHENQFIRRFSEKFIQAGYRLDLDKASKYNDRIKLIQEIFSHEENAHILSEYALDKKNLTDEFYDKVLLQPGHRLYVQCQMIPAWEVIAAIRSAGGIASAAHLPLYFRGLPNAERKTEEAVRKLKAFGLEALEVRYPDYTPAEQHLMEKLARRYRLLKTAGADFHGELSPGIRIGGFARPWRSYPKKLKKHVVKRFKKEVKAGLVPAQAVKPLLEARGISGTRKAERLAEKLKRKAQKKYRPLG